MKYMPARKILWLIAITCFASSYVISFDENSVSITIVNRTRYYLHILIDKDPHLYVAPGGSVHSETRMQSAFVEVLYSPGQGISGRAEKELTSTTTTSTNYSSDRGHTCASSSSGNSCQSMTSSEGSVSYSYTRSPMTWTVVPADFEPDSVSSSH